MARVYRIPHFFQFLIYFSLISCSFASLVSSTRELNEDNWREILDGEWLVEFYAPWCPACSALAPAWQELTDRAARQKVAKTAAVDVTQSPGLSGRFVVTALPTIFHVKDGVFRHYKGPRDASSLLQYVTEKRWQQAEPISSWKAPDSLQMGLVAEFFKLSQALRGVHTLLMEQYGLPTWGSYLIFAVATIFIGALLGLILVCIIDLLYPPRRPDKVMVSQAELDKKGQGDQDPTKSEDEQELINDDLVDDADNSDAEKNSPSDTSDDEPAASAGGDSKPASGDERQVRKRRARKAD